MTIYVNADYKCSIASAEGLLPVETEFFDGKCKQYIEGYRYVPEGREWKREDGKVFRGEMVAPWKDSKTLELAQSVYEESMAEIADMQTALNALGVNIDG